MVSNPTHKQNKQSPRTFDTKKDNITLEIQVCDGTMKCIVTRVVIVQQDTS
jgi:hypothetical protein